MFLMLENAKNTRHVSHSKQIFQRLLWLVKMMLENVKRPLLFVECEFPAEYVVSSNKEKKVALSKQSKLRRRRKYKSSYKRRSVGC